MNKQFLVSVNPDYFDAVTMMRNHMSLSRKSNVTIKTYVGYISRFINSQNRLPEDCSKSEIIDFLLSQKESYKVKFSTVKGYVIALRYYFKYIKENEAFSLKIPVPKIKDYDIEALSINEVKRMLEACSNSKQRLIIKMLYETGMRLGELVNLKIHQIDFNFKTISIINGKNRKTRVVGFGTELEHAILSYLEDFPYLFSTASVQDQRCSLIDISSSGIQYNVRNVKRRAGIVKRVTPHIFRHTFAVHFLNFGGSILRLQKILGHSNLNSTMHYLQYAALPEQSDISILDALVEIE